MLVPGRGSVQNFLSIYWGTDQKTISDEGHTPLKDSVC